MIYTRRFLEEYFSGSKNPDEFIANSQTKVEIIADSLGSNNCRITTFLLTFPRIVLSEFNTHRAFSRNSASSRAIPIEKMIKSIEENPFIPERWSKGAKGMSPGELIIDCEEIEKCKNVWLNARDHAISHVRNLLSFDIAKEQVNRLLEPFCMHRVLVTSTEWSNFFSLRAEKNAQFEIQFLAYLMLDEINTSIPKKLSVGEWHIPYQEKINLKTLFEYLQSQKNRKNSDIMLKISTAFAARTSYTLPDSTQNKLVNFEKDVELYNRLSENGHWSPFEHTAKQMKSDRFFANFRGFKQLRLFFKNQNRKDDRLKKF